jgi:hypothetical protein
VTGVAAAYAALPDCVAVMEQTPKLTIVAVLPETVQTLDVFEMKEIPRPDDAEAVKPNELAPPGVNGLNEIVCVAVATVKLRVTVGAAAYASFPA